MKTYSIYRICNKETQKIYVGFTCKELSERFEEHVGAALSNNKKFFLHGAIRKYGRDAFTIELIDFVFGDRSDAAKLEVFHIARLKSNNRVIGYNMTKGGDGGNLTESYTREEIAAKCKRCVDTKRARGNLKWTEAQRRKMQMKRALVSSKVSASLLKKSEKLSKTVKDRFANMSQEDKAKFRRTVSESQIKHFAKLKVNKQKYESYLKKLGDRTAKPVYAYGIIYRSPIEASEALKCSYSSIRNKMRDLRYVGTVFRVFN